MSEEAAAAATEPATPEAALEAPPADAAPPPEAAPPPPETPKTAEFQALARARGKLLKLEQESKQRVSGLETRQKDLDAREQKIAPLLTAMEKFEDDPEGFLTAFASSKGVDPQHFFNTLVTKLAHKGEPPDPVSEVQKLREEMAAKEAAEAKKREDAEKQRVEAESAQQRANIEQFLAADADKYEHVGLRLASEKGRETIHNHLMQMAKWYTSQGKDLTLEQAAVNLESYFVTKDKERLTSLIQSKKLAPPTIQAPAQTNASATPTKPAESAPAEQAALTPQPPKSLPKTIPIGRASVPAAGGRVVQRGSEDSERRAEWAKRLAAKS